MKPLLAIISLKPINGVYQINIKCQAKAAKLLKDVVKHASIEDPGAVEKLVDRLKVEISLLFQTHIRQAKAQDDDMETDMLLSYKQDFIRTCLRFLCYSIIRNDPSKSTLPSDSSIDAINFNQNFIANSRKILESNLIQNELVEFVFKRNKKDSSEEEKRAIDPILLQCKNPCEALNS